MDFPEGLRANEKCIYLILTKYGAQSTEEILSHVDEFPELCSGCRSGSYLIIAGRKLERKGHIVKKVSKGGFIWQLKR